MVLKGPLLSDDLGGIPHHRFVAVIPARDRRLGDTIRVGPTESSVATIASFARSPEPGTMEAFMLGRAEPDSNPSQQGCPRSNALRLLEDKNADAVQHLHGHLLDHLKRTEQLLLAWESSQALATAGLCHAFYGTDGLATALLGLHEREVLSIAVGPDVEATVYFYASCDRGFLYPQIGSGGLITFRDRFTGDVFSPTKDQLQAFVDLTLANEADVATFGSTPSTGVPAWFRSLVHQFGPCARHHVAEGCDQLVASGSPPTPDAEE
jgi:hypothetical protein